MRVLRARVTGELTRLGGVAEVKVERREPAATVIHDAPLPEQAVSAALDEAGYWAPVAACAAGGASLALGIAAGAILPPFAGPLLR